MKKIAVIGGGASGLIAAYFSAGKDNKVVLFEKQKKIGRKILVTGNGRCNITNLNINPIHYHGNNSKFVNNIFAKFGLDETIEFFQSIGLPFSEGKDGKLFPASLQANTVVKLFEYELLRKGVDIKLHRRIDEIISMGNKFKLITTGKENYIFDSVILSTGSCAYPKAGASKIGYKLAESLKHEVIQPFPAILPINIPLKIIHKLQGIKWDCEIKVKHKNKVVSSSQGELLFTGYGISGPASLDVSRSVNEMVLQGHKPKLIIDFFPEYTMDELIQLLNILWENNERSVSFSLAGILKERVPEVLLKIINIDPEKKVDSLTKNEKRQIAEILKALILEPGEPRTFEDAVVAVGGVNVNEINASSMESKFINNLFITGELLDIDGDSGGYNLQFAWSTGAIAGMAQ